MWILLGKFGDIVNILPMLHHHYKLTGQRQVLMVAKKYAGLLTGCSYVEPFIFDGDFSELKQAYTIAKSKFSDVKCLQVFGKDFPFERRCPNFQQEQWLRGGMIQHFRKLPLVIDQRNAEREEKLLKEYGISEPFILVADKSESSPFEQVDDLLTALSMLNVHIVKLSQIHADQIYDLLAIYDKALVLIATETAHLHLSAASTVPVIALATDNDKWRGTVNNPSRFIFHCYYGEYNAKKNAMIEAVKACVNKSVTTTATAGVNTFKKVSCVIPIFKPSSEMLNKCLDAALPQVDEVILTMETGGQCPPTKPNKKVRLVVHPKSGIGFGANVNHGVKHAKHDTLLLLNDDLYLDDFAVERMLEVMDDRTAIVGMLTRYPNGLIYHSGKARKPDGSIGHPHIDGIGKTALATIVVPTEMENTNGAAMLVNKKAFDEVGGFDEGYKFYCEDDSLSMSVRQAGWKIMYQPYATGIHDGHQETKSSIDRMAIMKASNARFAEKWGWYFSLNKDNSGLGRFK